MKILPVVMVVFLCSFLLGNEAEYYILQEDSKTVKYFQYGKGSFLTYYSDSKEKIANQEYYVHVTEYAWGPIDSSYIRMGDDFFYHYSKKVKAESILLPRNPIIGFKWWENDSSWMYTVLKTDQLFTTPVKSYPNCILVECKQLTGRDKHKRPFYFLYYAKGIGYVGNVDSHGNVLSYLKEITTTSK